MTELTDAKILGKIGIESLENHIKVRSLIELLIDKGVFSEEEFDEKQRQIDKIEYKKMIEKIFGASYEELEKLSEEK